MTELEVVRKLQHCGVKEYRLALEQVEKSLKALEIIKEKNVDADLLTDVGSVEEYNIEIFFSYRKLNQKEFDLLKEVLE